MTAQVTEKQVVVIGSGLAGFAAAAKLIENGIDDILILEAENRIGGRIYSVPYEHGLIDLGELNVIFRRKKVDTHDEPSGGQWVHGQGGNSIYKMIDGNFLFGDTGFHGAASYFHRSDGFPLNQEQCANLSSLTWQVMGNYQDMANFPGSYGDFFAIEYLRQLRMNPKFKNTPWGLALMMRHYAHTGVNSYFASENWYQISARLAALTDGTEGNQWLTWKDEGFVTVFDFLSVKRNSF